MMQHNPIIFRDEWLAARYAAAALGRRILSALRRWLDSYLVWHSPQLAAVAMQAMAEKQRNDRSRNCVCEGALVDCCEPYLPAGCAGAVHRQSDI